MTSNPRFKFYLDGAEVLEPSGWETFRLDISREFSYPNEILQNTKADGKELFFHKDGYSYLSTKREEIGFCGSVALEIKEDCTQNGNYTPFYSGTIFLSDLMFNRTRCIVRTNPVSNSYHARIKNNRGIKVAINVGKSKNGVEIDTIDKWTVSMFDPCGGTTVIGRSASAYHPFDVGRYLIDWMSDGQIGFRSSLFESGGEWEGLFLASAEMIRNNGDGTETMELSWSEYLKEISVKVPLSYWIDESGAVPVLILESQEDSFDDEAGLHCPNANEVTEEININRLYSTVTFGSKETIDSDGCGASGQPAFPDQINFVGPKEETLVVSGQCNLDAGLDLTGEWITSSNIIETIFISFGEDYEGKICFLHCENLSYNTLIADAIRTDIFDQGTPVFYNAALFNDKVAARHFGGIPNTLAKEFVVNDYSFKAYHTGTETVTIPPVLISGLYTEYVFPFGQDYTNSTYDGFDLQNAYGNGTSPGTLIAQADCRFTAGYLAFYKFRVNLSFKFYGGFPNCYVTWSKYDSGGILTNEYTTVYNNLILYHTYTDLAFDSIPVIMNPGDYVIVKVGTPNVDFYGGSFELLSTSTSGGVFHEYKPEDFRALRYRFKYPLTSSQFKRLADNPRQKITFTSFDFSGAGWIEQLFYNPAGPNQGMGEFLLIASDNSKSI